MVDPDNGCTRDFVGSFVGIGNDVVLTVVVTLHEQILLSVSTQ